MRNLIARALLLASAFAADARSQSSPLAPGTRLRVTIIALADTNRRVYLSSIDEMNRRIGRLDSLVRDTIFLSTATDGMRIPMFRVALVERSLGMARGWNPMVTLAASAFAGGAIGYYLVRCDRADSYGCQTDRAESAYYGTIFGIGSGVYAVITHRSGERWARIPRSRFTIRPQSGGVKLSVRVAM